MSTEIITPEPSQNSGQNAQSEQGLLLAVLVMVILGVIAIFFVTA